MADKAADLDAKFEVFHGAVERHDYVGVKFWDTSIVDRDPALASLGGVVNIISGLAHSLDNGTLQIARVVEAKDVPGPDLMVIPRNQVLDLDFYGDKPVADDQLRKLADG